MVEAANCKDERHTCQKELTDAQIARLEAVGLKNHAQQNDVVWNKQYESARAFYLQYGYLNIPKGDKNKTDEWLESQRALHSSGKLSAERVTLLNAIGMNWNPTDAWEIGFRHAETYRRKNGDLDIPKDFVDEDGYRLGGWLSTQRRLCNCKKMDAKYVERLEQRGMVWHPVEENWQQAFDAIKVFKEQFGHLDVPRGYTSQDGIAFYDWVSSQRQRYAAHMLKQEKIDALESTGFCWISPKKRGWENRYEHVKAFYRQNGHLRISSHEQRSLYYWLQRQAHNKDKLNDEQISKLNDIGITWC